MRIKGEKVCLITIHGWMIKKEKKWILKYKIIYSAIKVQVNDM